MIRNIKIFVGHRQRIIKKSLCVRYIFNNKTTSFMKSRMKYSEWISVFGAGNMHLNMHVYINVLYIFTNPLMPFFFLLLFTRCSLLLKIVVCRN